MKEITQDLTRPVTLDNTLGYYLDSAEGRLGPLTQSQLKEMADSGQLVESAYLMCENANEWTEAKIIFPDLFPQETTIVSVPNGPVPPSQLIYAGFWSRVGGAVIDITLVTLTLGITGMFYLGISLLSEGLGAIIFFPFYMLLIFLTVLYKPVMHLTPWRATLGMRICGIKIRTEGGAWPDTGKIIIRTLGSLLSALAVGLGYIWMLGDKKKRTWHDRMAGTVVVIER